MRINYNKDTDYYILNRIYRESRNGTIVVNEEDGYIDFGVVVADIKRLFRLLEVFILELFPVLDMMMKAFLSRWTLNKLSVG